MHPSVGPWAEANLLYVEQLDLEGLMRSGDAPLRIFDVGLGAGTNALAALAAARRVSPRRPVEIHSFERDLDPLRLAVADPEGFADQARFEKETASVLAHGVWEEPGLIWRVWLGDCLELLARIAASLPSARGNDLDARLRSGGDAKREGPEPSAGGVDGPAQVVFFDPFSPKANPEMWTVAALEQVRAVMDPDGALLATYSAATPTRVSILLAGLFVGVGVGVGTKQETTVAATRLDLLRQHLDARFLSRWERSTSRAPHGETLTAAREEAIRSHAQFRRK
jgi:tRNA U34 5-methylaminomethyl-2-thiouridine-forming methyltransferase MnmC